MFSPAGRSDHVHKPTLNATVYSWDGSTDLHFFLFFLFFAVLTSTKMSLSLSLCAPGRERGAKKRAHTHQDRGYGLGARTAQTVVIEVQGVDMAAHAPQLNSGLGRGWVAGLAIPPSLPPILSFGREVKSDCNVRTSSFGGV